MKINDVIECINKTLEKERKALGIEAIGHFVYQSACVNRIGTVKEFQASINFVNFNIGHTIRVCSYYALESCPTDKVEEVKDRIALNVLEELLLLLRTGVDTYSYDKFLNGTFDDRTK